MRLLQRRDPFFVVLYGVFFALLLSLVIFSVTVWVRTAQARTFTAEKWQREPHNRHLILDDFLRRYDMTGWTKEKVERVLGTRERVAFDSSWRYTIYGGVADPRYFLVEFGKNGLVQKISVYEG